MKGLALTCLAGWIGAGCADRLSLTNPGHHVIEAPTPLPGDHPAVSLVAVAPDATRIRIDWRSRATADELPEVAAFVGTDRAALYAGLAVPLDTTQSSAILGGLTEATEYFVGLAVRGDPGRGWSARGAVMRVRTGVPTYVDPGASTNGDGTTPATPTNDLVLALFTAFVSGGGNVWVAQGVVDAGTLPLFTGVHVYGGFDPGFLLGRRDLDLTRTIVTATGNEIARVQVGGPGPAIFDGFTLIGDPTVANGVDDPGLDLELRGLDVRSCQRGIKLRSSPTGPSVPVVISGVRASGSELEGLSVDGAFDIVIDGSTFDSNGNEGADFNHLVAPEGGSASLVVRNSSFTRNGTEGLDCHLGAPVGSGPGGGHFVIHVEDCDFEANRLDGLRVDVDYETHPTWDAEIVVRGTRARANGAAGVHFDLDSHATALGQRLACTANVGPGFHVTSETVAGTCTLSASALVGNFGPGVWATLGNFGVVAAHCVFTGNDGGGFVSGVVNSIAHSSVAYLQPRPWTGVTAHACVVQDAIDPSPCLTAPREFARIESFTADGMTVGTIPVAATGAAVEVQDDGIPRALASVAGVALVVDPVPEVQPLPARVTFFGPGSGVGEDWRLSRASSALGAGMAPPGSAPSDAGIFGAPHAGVPGREDPVSADLFYVGGTTPPWSTGLAPTSALELRFVDGEPSTSSVQGAVFARGSTGDSLVISVSVRAGSIHVDPPSAGWQPGDVLEVHSTLTATDGRVLSIPFSLPLR